MTRELARNLWNANSIDVLDRFEGDCPELDIFLHSIETEQEAGKRKIVVAFLRKWANLLDY